MLEMTFSFKLRELNLDTRGLENSWAALMVDAARTVAERLYDDESGFAVMSSPVREHGGAVRQITAAYDDDGYIVVMYDRAVIIAKSVDRIP